MISKNLPYFESVPIDEAFKELIYSAYFDILLAPFLWWSAYMDG